MEQHICKQTVFCSKDVAYACMKCHISCEKHDLDEMIEEQNKKIKNICQILQAGILYDKYISLIDKKLNREEIDMIWNFDADQMVQMNEKMQFRHDSEKIEKIYKIVTDLQFKDEFERKLETNWEGDMDMFKRYLGYFELDRHLSAKIIWKVISKDNRTYNYHIYTNTRFQMVQFIVDLLDLKYHMVQDLLQDLHQNVYLITRVDMKIQTGFLGFDFSMQNSPQNGVQIIQNDLFKTFENLAQKIDQKTWSSSFSQNFPFYIYMYKKLGIKVHEDSYIYWYLDDPILH